MEVLQSNFPEALAKFSALLEKTELIAFDLEMSGINGEKPFSSDFPFEYYKKNFEAANKYKIIQVGLCLFQRAESSAELKAFPFTFYIFPRTVRGKMNVDLSMELGSVEFNVGAGGVDWNKWICRGVPYFDRRGLEIAEKILTGDRFAPKPGYAYELHKKEQRSDFEALMGKLRLWYAREDNELKTPADAFDPEREAGLRERGEMLEIDAKSFNVIMRTKLVAEKEMGGALFLTFKKSDKFSVIRAFKAGGEARARLLELHRAHLRAEFEEAKGFSALWERLKAALQARKIPMVGHNSMGDVLFLMSHLEARLRADYVAFKRSVKSVFAGGFFDTKNLARHLEGEANRLSLEELSKFLESTGKTRVVPAEGFEFGEGVFHNAGFDAYITGRAFAQLAERVGPAVLAQEKFKVKMFRIHDFMIDFGSEHSDQLNSDKGWAVLLDKRQIKALKQKPGGGGGMDALTREFARLFGEKKKKKSYRDFKYPKYDSDVFFAFADAVKQMAKKAFKGDRVRVFTNPHLSCFEDNYMVTLRIEDLAGAREMRHLLGDFGRLVTLGEAYRMYLDLYNKKFCKGTTGPGGI